MTCGAEGSKSLLAFAHSVDLMAGDQADEPVMAHVTVCPAHAQLVRVWLRRRSEDGEVTTISTERLMARWSQVMDPLGMPVVSPVQAAG